MVAPGGYQLGNHTDNPASITAIAAQPWDFVVMQEQSQFGALPFEVSAFEVGAAALVQLIEENDECTYPVFYMTWGRKNGDADNCPFYPEMCTYASMQQALRDNQSAEYLVQGIAACHLREPMAHQGITRHGRAIHAGLGERSRQAVQEDPVRCDGDVQIGTNAAEHLDQLGEISPNGGFAARDLDRAHPEFHVDPQEAGELFEGEDLFFGEPGETLCRHAVGAAEVASVRDRDPQVVGHATERVGQRSLARRGCGWRCPGRRHQAASLLAVLETGYGCAGGSAASRVSIADPNASDGVAPAAIMVPAATPRR